MLHCRRIPLDDYDLTALRVADPATGEAHCFVPFRRDSLRAALPMGGSWIAILSVAGELVAYDAHQRQVVATFRPEKKWFNGSLLRLADGAGVLLTDGYEYCVLRFPELTLIRTIATSGGGAMVLRPDGKLVTTCVRKKIVGEPVPGKPHQWAEHVGRQIIDLDSGTTHSDYAETFPENTGPNSFGWLSPAGTYGLRVRRNEIPVVGHSSHAHYRFLVELWKMEPLQFVRSLCVCEFTLEELWSTTNTDVHFAHEVDRQSSSYLNLKETIRRTNAQRQQDFDHYARTTSGQKGWLTRILPQTGSAAPRPWHDADSVYQFFHRLRSVLWEPSETAFWCQMTGYRFFRVPLEGNVQQLSFARLNDLEVRHRPFDYLSWRSDGKLRVSTSANESVTFDTQSLSPGIALHIVSRSDDCHEEGANKPAPDLVKEVEAQIVTRIALGGLGDADCIAAIETLTQALKTRIESMVWGQQMPIAFALPDREMTEAEFFDHVRDQCPAAIPALRELIRVYIDEAPNVTRYEQIYQAKSLQAISLGHAMRALALTDESSLPLLQEFLEKLVDGEHEVFTCNETVPQVLAAHGIRTGIAIRLAISIGVRRLHRYNSSPEWQAIWIECGLRPAAQTVLGAQRFADLLMEEYVGLLVEASGALKRGPQMTDEVYSSRIRQARQAVQNHLKEFTRILSADDPFDRDVAKALTQAEAALIAAPVGS